MFDGKEWLWAEAEAKSLHRKISGGWVVNYPVRLQFEMAFTQKKPVLVIIKLKI